MYFDNSAERDTLRTPNNMKGMAYGHQMATPLDNEIFHQEKVEAYGQVRALNSPIDPRLLGTKYALTLKIYYKTVPGESICVLGSIPELGLWKDIVCHLKWTEGHIWVTEKPIITSHPYFNYKYMQLDDDKKTMVKWEAGIDRIVDLRLLPEIKRVETNRDTMIVEMAPLESHEAEPLPIDTSNIKHVELYDEWEMFKFRFSVFYPAESMDEEINLEVDKLGAETLRMEKTNADLKWMHAKYGQKMRPWVVEFKMFNNESGNSG